MTAVRRYTVDASLFDGTGSLALDVIGFDFDMDMDRIPYMSGTMVINDPGDIDWPRFDPRPRDPGASILYNVHRFVSTDGAMVETETVFPSATSAGVFWIDDAERDLVEGTATLRLVGEEVQMDEKRNSTTAAIATGATTVRALAVYLLGTINQGLASYDSIVNTTAIPAGTRRDWQPGDTANEMLEPELDAIQCRLWCDPFGAWSATSVNSPPPSPVNGITLQSGDGGALLGAKHRLSRAGEYHDSTLIRYQYTPVGGAQVTSYFASTATAAPRAKTRFITESRPRPTSDPTDAIEARDKKRGQSFIITALARLDVWPGALVSLIIPPAVYPILVIRRLAIDVVSGVMTIEAEPQ